MNIRHSPFVSKFIAWLCSILVVLNSLYIFVHVIYPIIINNSTLALNLDNLKFDFKITYQIFCAYCLLILGISLPGRSRIIWILCLVNLMLILISGFVVTNTLHNVGLISISVLVLCLAYPYFYRQFYLSYSVVFIFAFIVFAIFYGSFGCYLLRGDFKGIATLGDAVYFTVITYSTVGYGDILPLTQSAKYFVISMVVIGLIMFTSGITLIAYTLSSTLKNLLFNFNKGKISMTNHIVFIGYGILTRILIEDYQKTHEKYLVIDVTENLDTEKKLLLESQKLMISPYPGHIDTMVQARLSEAKLIIASFDSDSDTIFAVMCVAEYLKQFTKRPKIIARIFYQENIAKAKTAGADDVVAPHLLAAMEILKLTH